jgi:hypothetical protein
MEMYRDVCPRTTALSTPRILLLDSLSYELPPSAA